MPPVSDAVATGKRRDMEAVRTDRAQEKVKVERDLWDVKLNGELHQG